MGWEGGSSCRWQPHGDAQAARPHPTPHPCCVCCCCCRCRCCCLCHLCCCCMRSPTSMRFMMVFTVASPLRSGSSEAALRSPSIMGASASWGVWEGGGGLRDGGHGRQGWHPALAPKRRLHPSPPRRRRNGVRKASAASTRPHTMHTPPLPPPCRAPPHKHAHAHEHARAPPQPPPLAPDSKRHTSQRDPEVMPPLVPSATN